MDIKNWYVITTKPKAEKQVSKQLTAINIEHYLPLHKQLRVWHDRKKWVEMSLFGSYIFVHIEEAKRNDVFAVNGVLKYVSTARQASVLSEYEIERIRTICNYAGEVEIEREIFRQGDEVEIISGHFSGFKGEIISINGKLKFRISIPVMNSSAKVAIDKEQVIKTK